MAAGAERQAVRPALRRRAGAQPSTPRGDLPALFFGPDQAGTGRVKATELVALVRQRFSGRPDSEHGQALVRRGVLAVGLAYMLLHGPRGMEEAYHDVRLIVAARFLAATSPATAIVPRPGVSRARRPVGPVSHPGLLAAAIIRIGDPLAWVYVI